ncbi:MAG: S1C family serine protease [Alphaproteobacteria bacterium]
MRTGVILSSLIGAVFATAAFAQSVEGLGERITKGNQPLKGTMPEVNVTGGKDTAAQGKKAKAALLKVDKTKPLAIRGAKEAQIFQQISPSVVLVLTDDGIGSGSLLPDGRVLTNWHVVEGFDEVGVIFKPEQEGRELRRADLLGAQVIKVDQVRDLALLELAIKPGNRKPIAFGDEVGIKVGADVHAIGHPTGEAWSYTKGIISQYRKNYAWRTESGIDHKADVIQTQTPINPGNSGGPLLDDKGKLIGVNAFKAQGEGLNFAISVGDVRAFLASPESRIVKQDKPGGKCEAKILYEGRNEKNTGNFRVYDTDCDGKADIAFLDYDDKSKPYVLFIDTNGDEKWDILVFDEDRDGKWDYSFHDTDFDGKPDLIGYHPDGKLKPSRYEPYKG